MYAALPERSRKRMIALQPPRYRPEVLDRHAISARRVDPEARLPGAVLLRAEGSQLGEDRDYFTIAAVPHCFCARANLGSAAGAIEALLHSWGNARR